MPYKFAKKAPSDPSERSLENILDGIDRDDIVRFSGHYDAPPEGNESASYGRFEVLRRQDKPEPTDYYRPQLLSGSDYSGGIAEKSNHDAFLEMYGEIPGVHHVYGGHGTYAVVIRLDAINDEMLDTFAGLANYPLIDEEKHSEMETKAHDEAWGNFYEHDWKKGLVQKVDAILEHEVLNFDALDQDLTDTVEEVVDAIPADKLREFFEDSREDANQYWETEQGGGGYVDVKRVLAKTDIDEILAEARKRIPAAAFRDADAPEPEYIDPRQIRLPGVTERRK